MAQVNIISDGTSNGTRVIDADGKEIVGMTRVSWSIGARGVAKVYVEFDAVKIDAPGVLCAPKQEGTPQ